jgi:hypothetical protein
MEEFLGFFETTDLDRALEKILFFFFSSFSSLSSLSRDEWLFSLLPFSLGFASADMVVGLWSSLTNFFPFSLVTQTVVKTPHYELFVFASFNLQKQNNFTSLKIIHYIIFLYSLLESLMILISLFYYSKKSVYKSTHTTKIKSWLERERNCALRLLLVHMPTAA